MDKTESKAVNKTTSKTVELPDSTQTALIEMQQQMLGLVVRISCLEKLLIGKAIKEEDYKKEVGEAIQMVDTLVSDKLQALLSTEEKGEIKPLDKTVKKDIEKV